ncbi:unnamed protein product [Protopolystoma xenopodis]|uniref:Uncharacterized protein n=1 Tax=Protopolystoma xenopodis TaxID=117903 RepID=A0A3S5AZG5_9PLAT|nr:unnamed protein product [Protopolystoma xenopodis]
MQNSVKMGFCNDFRLFVTSAPSGSVGDRTSMHKKGPKGEKSQRNRRDSVKQCPEAAVVVLRHQKPQTDLSEEPSQRRFQPAVEHLYFGLMPHLGCGLKSA